MIPTMIVFGLVFGRWWKTALVVGTLAWPALLLAASTIAAGDIPLALGLGLANTAVGVAVHQGLLRGVRGLRRLRALESTPPSSTT
ncbi:MAG: hypothetical protein M3144_01415 [Actinomycetota bacterium]|nr:hypothetical protein [Actinomycetota bacterium]